MKKFLVLVILGIGLSGCQVDTTDAKNNNKNNYLDIHSVCIDSVQYWVGGNMLSVRIDQKTLKPKLCKP